MIKHFNYYLTGTGWAEVFFSNEKENIRFDISYLSNPISDLINGLLRMFNRQSETEKIDFYEEPGKHFLTITNYDTDSLTIQIYWSDSWEESINSTRKLLYSDNDTLSNFSKIVCSGIDSLLERHTLKEYKERWVEHEFPNESFNELKQKLV